MRARKKLLDVYPNVMNLLTWPQNAEVSLLPHELKNLVHHSDQGVQYASKEYVGCLKRHGILVSMSHKGNPYDNAFAESFIKTLNAKKFI